MSNPNWTNGKSANGLDKGLDADTSYECLTRDQLLEARASDEVHEDRAPRKVYVRKLG